MNDPRRIAALAALGTALPAAVAAAAQHEAAAASEATGAAHTETAPAEPNVIPPVWEGLAPAFGSLIVFGIVLWVLWAKVWPRIVGGLDDRAAKIRTEIEAAELSQQQAREALEQYEKNLADARAEAASMLNGARAKQQQIAADLKAKADAELSSMRERAMRDIEAAKRAAVGEVYQEAHQFATMIASKILQREISAEDQRRLVEESLNELQTVTPS